MSIMKKADKIRYILKYQKDIDASLMDDFQTYTKKELEAMKVPEITTIFMDLIDAEQIMENVYNEEYRSE